MPIYSYQCGAGHTAELVRGYSVAAVLCEVCGGEATRKSVSPSPGLRGGAGLVRFLFSPRPSHVFPVASLALPALPPSPWPNVGVVGRVFVALRAMGLGFLPFPGGASAHVYERRDWLQVGQSYASPDLTEMVKLDTRIKVAHDLNPVPSMGQAYGLRISPKHAVAIRVHEPRPQVARIGLVNLLRETLKGRASGSKSTHSVYTLHALSEGTQCPC